MAIIQPAPGHPWTPGHSGGGLRTSTRGTAVLQSMPTVIQPVSDRWDSLKARLTAVMLRWDGLTAIQQSGWATYASQIPVPNAQTGVLNFLTSTAMWVHTNLPRYSASLPLLQDAPDPLPLPSPGIDGLTLDDPITLRIDVSDGSWSSDNPNAGLMAHQLDITLPPGPNQELHGQQVGVLTGNATTPPPNPWTVFLARPVAVGQRCWIGIVRMEPVSGTSQKHLYAVDR